MPKRRAISAGMVIMFFWVTVVIMEYSVFHDFLDVKGQGCQTIAAKRGANGLDTAGCARKNSATAPQGHRWSPEGAA
jgi:hypothetical protein